MTRIEWTRLAGDDVEAVVAMMVNRVRPNSVRITPSRGDGGVDILDRGGASDGSDAVHQVKRYAAPLTSVQYKAIESSLEALVTDPRWKTLHVATWFLVMPWDPSPEAEAWLQALGERFGVEAVWHGLTYIEQLAAKYPDVVDYYLHGGRGAVQEAFVSLHALFNLVGPDEGLDIPTFASRVEVAMRAVNTDPHYRYEIRVVEGELPEPAIRPGLALTWMQGKVNGGPWVAVDVIARCAASFEERPITVAGAIRAEVGSEFEKELRDFLAYGAPFDSPYGAYTGEMDAPGGLSGSIVDARIKTMPVNEDLGDNPNLRAEVLNSTGEVLHAIELRRHERTRGQEGLRVVLEEVNGVFQVEDRYENDLKGGGRQLRFHDIVGQPVMTVLPALRFLAACVAPNSVRVSRAHTPAGRGVADANWLFPWGEQMREEFDSELRVLEVLAVLQGETDDVIRVPGPEVERPRIRDWINASRLLAGEEVRMTYPEGQSLRLVVDLDLEIVSGTFGINSPAPVVVGDVKVVLEGVQLWLHDAEVLNRYEHDGKAVFEIVTPGRVVSYRMPAASSTNDAERSTGP